METCPACVLSCPVLLPGLSAGHVVEDAVMVDIKNAVAEELADRCTVRVRADSGTPLF